MQSDETFARRVCVVLLANVTGYSALPSMDDQRGARAVHHSQERLRAMVAEAGGRAEPVAGSV